MKLGIISRKSAEYLMGSAAVAGGFVITGSDEWNRCHTLDCILAHDQFLAALPDHFTEPIVPVEKKFLLGVINEDIQRTATRNWAVSQKQNDVKFLMNFKDRIQNLECP